MKDGDCAGLAAFNGDSGVLTIKKEGKKLVLQMTEQKVSLTDREKAVTKVDEKIVETVDLSAAFKSQASKNKSQIIYLRLDGDFQPRHGDAANFYYSLPRTIACSSTIVVSSWDRSLAFSTMPPRRLAAMLMLTSSAIQRPRNKL